MSEQVGSVTRKKSPDLTFMVKFDFNRGLQSDGNLKIKNFSKYSWTLLFRSPKENGKKLEIAGLWNNRGSVKGKGKSKGIRSSFEIAGTSN